MRARAGVREHRLEAEAAGLEAVVAVDEVLRRDRVGAPVAQQVGGQRLRVGRELRGRRYRERRVADADLDRAVLGLGPDVPVEVLHARDDAVAGHLVEVAVELLPRADLRHVAREREGRHRVQARGLERRVLALVEGRRGRQRDEVRDVARHPVREVDRVVAGLHADVDVLPEDRELLGEVAVERGHLQEALGREDAPVAPVVEGVRAAAGHREVQAPGLPHDRVAHLHQLVPQDVEAAVHRGVHLDHALGDLGLHLAGERPLAEAAQQVGGAAREVVVARVEHHQLQLDAEGEGFGLREFEGHGRLRLSGRADGFASPRASRRVGPGSGGVSPAKRRPHCTASGPAISITMTEARSTAASGLAELRVEPHDVVLQQERQRRHGQQRRAQRQRLPHPHAAQRREGEHAGELGRGARGHEGEPPPTRPPRRPRAAGSRR